MRGPRVHQAAQCAVLRRFDDARGPKGTSRGRCRIVSEMKASPSVLAWPASLLPLFRRKCPRRCAARRAGDVYGAPGLSRPIAPPARCATRPCSVAAVDGSSSCAAEWSEFLQPVPPRYDLRPVGPCRPPINSRLSISAGGAVCTGDAAAASRQHFVSRPARRSGPTPAASRLSQYTGR